MRLCLSTKLLPVDCSKMMTPLTAQGCVLCVREEQPEFHILPHPPWVWLLPSGCIASWI